MRLVWALNLRFSWNKCANRLWSIENVNRKSRNCWRNGRKIEVENKGSLGKGATEGQEEKEKSKGSDRETEEIGMKTGIKKREGAKKKNKVKRGGKRIERGAGIKTTKIIKITRQDLGIGTDKNEVIKKITIKGTELAICWTIWRRCSNIRHISRIRLILRALCMKWFWIHRVRLNLTILIKTWWINRTILYTKTEKNLGIEMGLGNIAGIITETIIETIIEIIIEIITESTGTAAGTTVWVWVRKIIRRTWKSLVR